MWLFAKQPFRYIWIVNMPLSSLGIKWGLYSLQSRCEIQCLFIWPPGSWSSGFHISRCSEHSHKGFTPPVHTCWSCPRFISMNGMWVNCRYCAYLPLQYKPVFQAAVTIYILTMLMIYLLQLLVLLDLNFLPAIWM